MTRVIGCGDCDCTGDVGAYTCVRCGGTGGVVDVLGEDSSPVISPDAIPVSFLEAAMLAASIGGPDALLLAVGALRRRAA